MKLKKFIPLIDFLQEIEIWTSDQEDGEDPFYSGTVFDCPFILCDMKIGRINDPEEPIYTYIKNNKTVMVINLIDPGSKKKKKKRND